MVLWDTVSLTKVGVVNAPSSEIRAIEHIQGTETFFAASKGLLKYDYRKMSESSPYERIEPNLDIFSLTSTPDYLFFGSRDHRVYPYSLSDESVCNPLHPPHFDVVTSLSMLGGGLTLVSGSRDKNLRTYNLARDPYREN